MSLTSAFKHWCLSKGYVPRSTVYLNDGLRGLRHGTARMVRMVDCRKRAGNRRHQQYVVEVQYHGEIYYPFGTSGLPKQKFLAAMMADIGKE